MSKDPCWKGYKQVGMKKKNGKKVPNCVPTKKTKKEKKKEKEKTADLVNGVRTMLKNNPSVVGALTGGTLTTAREIAEQHGDISSGQQKGYDWYGLTESGLIGSGLGAGAGSIYKNKGAIKGSVEKLKRDASRNASRIDDILKDARETSRKRRKRFYGIFDKV